MRIAYGIIPKGLNRLLRSDLVNQRTLDFQFWVDGSPGSLEKVLIMSIITWKIITNN